MPAAKSLERSLRATTLFNEEAEGMADNLKRIARLDGSRINIEQDYEVRYWCEKLGVSEDQLKSAVAKAGPMVKNVREHLQLQD